MILKTIDLVYPFPLKNKENEAQKCDYLKDQLSAEPQYFLLSQHSGECHPHIRRAS